MLSKILAPLNKIYSIFVVNPTKDLPKIFNHLNEIEENVKKNLLLGIKNNIVLQNKNYMIINDITTDKIYNSIINLENRIKKIEQEFIKKNKNYNNEEVLKEILQNFIQEYNIAQQNNKKKEKEENNKKEKEDNNKENKKENNMKINTNNILSSNDIGFMAETLNNVLKDEYGIETISMKKIYGLLRIHNEYANLYLLKYYTNIHLLKGKHNDLKKALNTPLIYYINTIYIKFSDKEAFIRFKENYLNDILTKDKEKIIDYNFNEENNELVLMFFKIKLDIFKYMYIAFGIYNSSGQSYNDTLLTHYISSSPDIVLKRQDVLNQELIKSNFYKKPIVHSVIPRDVYEDEEQKTLTYKYNNCQAYFGNDRYLNVNKPTPLQKVGGYAYGYITNFLFTIGGLMFSRGVELLHTRFFKGFFEDINYHNYNMPFGQLELRLAQEQTDEYSIGSPARKNGLTLERMIISEENAGEYIIDKLYTDLLLPTSYLIENYLKHLLYKYGKHPLNIEEINMIIKFHIFNSPVLRKQNYYIGNAVFGVDKNLFNNEMDLYFYPLIFLIE